MPWTEKSVHPRYKEVAATIQTYILGVLDSCFRSQYGGRTMQEALTQHLYEKMEKMAGAAAIVAIKGYIPICKDHRKVVDNRSRRTAKHANRKTTAKQRKTAAK